MNLDELHEEFHSSFWSYVRTGQGESGDDREQMLAGIVDLSATDVAGFMEAHDVAALLSGCTVADDKKVLAAQGRIYADGESFSLDDLVLLKAEDPKIARLLDQLRVGHEARIRSFYVDVASCIAWAQQQPGIRVYCKGGASAND